MTVEIAIFLMSSILVIFLLIMKKQDKTIKDTMDALETLEMVMDILDQENEMQRKKILELEDKSNG